MTLSVGLTPPGGPTRWHEMPAWWDATPLVPLAGRGVLDVGGLATADRTQVLAACVVADPAFSATAGWAVEFRTEEG